MWLCRCRYAVTLTISPPAFACPGCRVEIPFGPQTLVGLVVDHPADSQVPRNKLKPIKRVLDSAPCWGPTFWR